MTIEFLQLLKDNKTLNVFTNRGLNEEQIRLLEHLYNNGNPFPKILKELLFLAGEFCHALDFSIHDTQQELQDEERKELMEVYNISISRPHFFVEVSPDGHHCFLFLDEGDNPELKQLCNPLMPNDYYRGTGGTLQDLINYRIRHEKKKNRN